MTGLIEALSPGLLALGFCLLILPWLDSERLLARAAMVAVAFLLLTRYFVWRTTDTVPAAGWTSISRSASCFSSRKPCRWSRASSTFSS